MKKGMSPIIATVLLIGIAVVLAALISTNISSISETKLSATECTLSLRISDVGFDKNTNLLIFKLNNEGNAAMKDFTGSVVYSDSSNNIERINLHNLSLAGEKSLGLNLTSNTMDTAVINTTIRGVASGTVPLKIEVIAGNCPPNTPATGLILEKAVQKFSCPDVNWDGVINANDASFISNYYFNDPNCPPYDCDLNDDGLIRVGDGTFVINAIAAGKSLLDFPTCTYVPKAI